MRRVCEPEAWRGFAAAMEDDLLAGCEDSMCERWVDLDEQALSVINAIVKGVGVDRMLFIENLLSAELKKICRIRNQGLSLQEKNAIFTESSPCSGTPQNELNVLIANYHSVNLSDISNSALQIQAENALGLRFNNYRAFRMQSFSGLKPVEIILYIDRKGSGLYQRGWLASGQGTVKHIDFKCATYFNTTIDAINHFIFSTDYNTLHLHPEGCRSE